MSTVGDKEKRVDVEVQKGEALIIEPASKMNRVRDIGLFIVAALLLITMFLGWRETSNREAANKIIEEYYKKELKQFRDEEEKKLQVVADISKTNHKKTQELIFKAWLDHDAKLKKLTDLVERIEKRKPPKEK